MASIRKAKKKFFKEQSALLAHGYSTIAYISPNTVKYVVKKLSKLSKQWLIYYLYSNYENDCWVIKVKQ